MNLKVNDQIIVTPKIEGDTLRFVSVEQVLNPHEAIANGYILLEAEEGEFWHRNYESAMQRIRARRVR